MKDLKLLAFCGPSGSGKTSIVKAILSEFNNLSFSISATTRKKRPHETDGKDYYFLTEEAFRKRIEDNEFIEFEEVYTGIFYGTLWSEVERIFSEASFPVLDIDVYGAASIKKKYAAKALVFFVHPGSEEELKKRLGKRSTETEKELASRLNKAREELGFAKQADYIIDNSKDLENSIRQTRLIIQKAIS
jgi:guanylate kinase